MTHTNPIIRTATDMKVSAARVLQGMERDIRDTQKFIESESKYSEDHRNHDLLSKYKTHLADLKEAQAFFTNQAAA